MINTEVPVGALYIQSFPILRKYGLTKIIIPSAIPMQQQQFILGIVSFV